MYSNCLFLFSFVSLFVVGPPRTQGSVVGTNKYTGEVANFALQPVPSPGGVLLVGSSTFKRWTNAVQDLAPLPVTNRAFGGSQTFHQLLFFDQVVSPCHPKLIVWYCGSNDVKGKKEPQGILQRTEEWLDKVMKYDSSTLGFTGLNSSVPTKTSGCPDRCGGCGKSWL